MSFTTFHRFRGFNSLAKINTSVRMDGEILLWVDNRIKDRTFASRTHAVEYALRQLMKREALQRS